MQRDSHMNHFGEQFYLLLRGLILVFTEMYSYSICGSSSPTLFFQAHRVAQKISIGVIFNAPFYTVPWHSEGLDLFTATQPGNISNDKLLKVPATSQGQLNRLISYAQLIPAFEFARTIDVS